MKHKLQPTAAATQAFLGIDVSKATFDTALLLPDSRLLQKSLPNTNQGFKDLKKWVFSHAGKLPLHCVMEATGTYYEALALHIHTWGHTLSVVNPRQIKAYADSSLRRSKTDRVDACIIARFAAAQTPRAWLPPTPAQRELQELSRRQQSLVSMRSMEKNRLACVQCASVRESLVRHLRALDTELAEVEAAIARSIAADGQLSAREALLRGIGACTAARILGEIPDITHFGSARQLGAHGGLTPRREQSGTSINRRGGICRIGSSRLRSHLYFPAIAAMRCNPLIMDFASRLRQGGKPPKVIITAVMRKLLHIIFGVLASNHPFNPRFLQPSP